MKTLIFTLLILAAAMTAAFAQNPAQPTFSALLASGPEAEHRDQLMLFGQFVGDWKCEAIEYHPDGTRVTVNGEIHFRWVLQGRAIQDVWIETERSDQGVKVYGTTLRSYDPKTDTWQTVWVDPAHGYVQQLTGRKIGNEIVMEGKRPNGVTIHWIFSEITHDSFRWRGERLVEGSWRMIEECRAHRLIAAAY